MKVISISQSGQVTIPATIRKHLAVGRYLKITTDGGKILLTPTTPKKDHRSVATALADGLRDLATGRTYGPFEAVAEIHEHFRTHPVDED